MIIAQISDIHADGSRSALQRLDGVLDWLAVVRPDHLIVSGDVAEIAHATNYGIVRERLVALRTPFQLVPGNVDDHAALRAVFGQDHSWSEAEPLSSVREMAGSVRTIGLDVTVSGGHHGDAGPVLDWLAAELNSGGPPALIFQHQHPFMTGIEGRDRNYCFNNEALSRVIGSAGDTVLGLTCGHVHRALFTRFAGVPASMAPSVAPANLLRLDGREAPRATLPGALIHHVKDGVLVSHAIAVE